MKQMYTFDKNRMREVLKTYLGNEHWKSVYQGAPSDECKQFFRLNFYSSMTGEPSGDELSEIRQKIYDALSIEDWKYLQKTHPGTPFTKVCADYIKKLQDK